ncbi:MAG: nuclear transport factor 2 family protein [Bacteroidaceae bacterium]|nr:nuclear transport factor 2 family protein [Bacteroidaceae bacterium]
MTDREQIAEQYHCMYRAMVEKDSATLDAVHASEFVLVHMTGMHQPKSVYIQSILNGTLNYYSAAHEQLDIHIDGDHATLVGCSRVEAAVFGGGRHTWSLQLRFRLVRRNGQWLFTEAQASTY